MSDQNTIVAELHRKLPQGTLRDVLPGDIEDERGRKGCAPIIVATPENTEQVASIIRTCAEYGLAVVPRGGGTGLVIGQFPFQSEKWLLLSLERMSAIRAILPEENVIVVEAGAVLADVQEAAARSGRLFPLSLASQGSCRIGGNLATNAGGVNVLRYGNARDLCLGVEAVLPDGSILHGLKRLRKDNTGYDLRNLLIGSEGTLGVITAAALRLFPRPARTGTALFVVPSPIAALRLLNIAQSISAEFITAFELMDSTGMHLLSETMPEVRLPFQKIPNWSVLVELGVPKIHDPDAMFEAIFQQGLEAEDVEDGVVAQNDQQSAELWNVRESIPEANRLTGGIAFHDISVPVSLVPEFIERAETALSVFAGTRVGVFGHMGDGNLHYNVFPAAGVSKPDDPRVGRAITRIVHDLVHELGGSFSAEHGVGRMKLSELERYGDPAGLTAMRAIKRALDPRGIMNPGAVLARCD